VLEPVSNLFGAPASRTFATLVCPFLTILAYSSEFISDEDHEQCACCREPLVEDYAIIQPESFQDTSGISQGQDSVTKTSCRTCIRTVLAVVEIC